MELVTTLSGMFLGSASILLTWMVVGAAMAGLGLGLRRLIGLIEVDTRRCLMAFWTGFALVILFLQFWNFLFPVQWPALTLVLAAGALGLWATRTGLQRWLGLRPWRAHRVAVGLTLVLLLWVANQASNVATQYDSGLYHAQAVRWFASYPAVPGLAHLHGRLAFNNASLLYAAMLDVGPWAGRAMHLANGLLLTAFLVQVVVSLVAFRESASEDRPRHLFTLLLFAPVIVSAMHEDIRSYTTDLSLAIVLFAIAAQLYASLTRPDPDPKEEAFNLGWLVSLFVVAVCVKLSAAVFAAAGCLLVAGLWLRHARLQPAWPRRRLWLVPVVPLLLTVSWLGRGAVLSGYPAYPASFWSLPVDWKVPEEQAVAEQQWIAHAARYAQTGLGVGWDWFRPWLEARTRSKYSLVRVILPFFLAAAALLVYWLQRVWRRPGRAAPGGWLMLVPALAGLAFWFVTAPSVRFVFPVLWLVAATCLCQTLQPHPAQSRRWVFSGALLLGFLPVALPLLRVVTDSGLNPSRLLAVVRYSLVVLPGPDRGMHPTRVPSLRQEVTNSGLILFVPDANPLCWDAPLPCTPHPAKNLRLRRPDDLGSGFAIEGPWAPENWPNPKFAFVAFMRCVRDEQARGSDGRSCVMRFAASGAGDAGPDE